MSHRITDIAGHEWTEGDYVFYGSDRGELTYAKVLKVEGKWYEKFSGGHWNYVVWVTRIRTTGYIDITPDSKPVRLTKITNIVKAPAASWNEE